MSFSLLPFAFSPLSPSIYLSLVFNICSCLHPHILSLPVSHSFSLSLLYTYVHLNISHEMSDDIFLKNNPFFIYFFATNRLLRAWQLNLPSTKNRGTYSDPSMLFSILVLFSHLECASKLIYRSLCDVNWIELSFILPFHFHKPVQKHCKYKLFKSQ